MVNLPNGSNGPNGEDLQWFPLVLMALMVKLPNGSNGSNGKKPTKPWANSLMVLLVPDGFFPIGFSDFFQQGILGKHA